MVTSKAKTVDAFLAQADPAVRPALEAFRRLVRKAVPKATESMRFGMPSYELGAPIAAFNAQKNYLSFYLCEADLLAARREEFRGLDCGKSCVRAKRLEQFPLDVLAELLRSSAQRAAKRTATGSSAPSASSSRRAAGSRARKPSPRKSAPARRPTRR